MNDSRMGFFQKIYHSVAGFDKYRYFITQRPGKAFVYLLLLSLILGSISLITPILNYDKTITDLTRNFDKSIPNFNFSNGKLSVEGKMPIIISEEGSTIIIDTSETADESILDQYDNAILILKDKMVQKSYVQRRETLFSLMQGYSFDREAVKRSLPILRIGTGLIAFFGLIFFVCGKLISALIVSLAGLIINSARGTRLLYSDIFKISAYSLTLPMLIGTVLDLTGVSIPFLVPAFYIIAIVYVWGAINKIKKDMEAPQIPPLPPIE